MRCGTLIPASAADDRLRLSGRVEVVQRFYQVRDARGRFIRPRCVRVEREVRCNLVTLAGRTFFCSRARGNSNDAPLSHYALGTNAGAPAASQTALIAESFRSVLTRTKADNGQLQLTLYLGRTQGNGVTYREGGAFNAATGGTMAARVTFSDKAKSNTNTLTVIHTITLAAS